MVACHSAGKCEPLPSSGPGGDGPNERGPSFLSLGRRGLYTERARAREQDDRGGVAAGVKFETEFG